MLIFTIIMSLTMLGMGLYLGKGGPKEINKCLGYRSKRAMSSQESWEFAQKEAGNHNAIIMRSDENNAFIGGPKKEKNNTADMSVFLQVAKSAKKEGFTSIFIGKDLSPEAKEKAAAAAAIEKLKVSGDKPKEIDLKKSYIKELPPTARKEIRRYNYSNMNADERKEYKRKQKLLRKTGRLKRANDGNIQAPRNSFINENSAELQATVTGKMLPGNFYEGGRE